MSQTSQADQHADVHYFLEWVGIDYGPEVRDRCRRLCESRRGEDLHTLSILQQALTGPGGQPTAVAAALPGGRH